MKTLALLRHAKSSWDTPGLDDFDRPLNPRGRAAAKRMGEEMRSLGIDFDLALVSPARRAADTFELVITAWGSEVERRLEPRLYHASPDAMLAIAGEVADGVERLMLVGHNPGMQELALRLTGGDRTEALVGKFPTGALAEIALPIDSWKCQGDWIGSLTRFVRPRDLD